MNKADRASNLLMDDFFMDEIASLKVMCIQQITNSMHDDIDARESAYQMHRAIDAVLNHFKSIADQKLIDEKRWKIF